MGARYTTGVMVVVGLRGGGRQAGIRRLGHTGVGRLRSRRLILVRVVATTTAAAAEQKLSLPKDKLPNNFYKVANELFEEFWTMDFDDVEITWAFFAKINFLNCKEYNLEDFAEESSSLAIIKVQ